MISSRAGARSRSSVSFGNVSRILPLKLSIKPFCMGLFPGQLVENIEDPEAATIRTQSCAVHPQSKAATLS
jgi:hypothetical protein